LKVAFEEVHLVAQSNLDDMLMPLIVPKMIKTNRYSWNGMLMLLIVLNDKASNLLWEINFKVCLKEQNPHSLRDCWTMIIRKKGQR